MNSTRRGFLTTFAGLAAISPWRPGWSEPPPRGAHDTSPSAATASPESPPDRPGSWLSLPRLPLMRQHLKSLGETRATDCFVAALAMERIRTGKALGFFYQGGSEPGSFRVVLPVLLFTVPIHAGAPDLKREPVYLLAHCRTRQAARTFRLDRISL